jgi:hypothetical protein
VAGLLPPGGAFGQLEYPTPPLITGWREYCTARVIGGAQWDAYQQAAMTAKAAGGGPREQVHPQCGQESAAATGPLTRPRLLLRAASSGCTGGKISVSYFASARAYGMLRQVGLSSVIGVAECASPPELAHHQHGDPAVF